MAKVVIKAYPSHSMVLLAFDWPDGNNTLDFLGFAIKRTPGFFNQQSSWLPNRISFDGPHPQGGDYPSNTSPIQKFMWWDARFDQGDQGKTILYVVTPVTGTKDDLDLVDADSGSIEVKIPENKENGIGTYFNRAVVSSQAFSKKFLNTPNFDEEAALSWLANGLEKVIPEFIAGTDGLEGAIYHLTDDEWTIPAFDSYLNDFSLVYHIKSSDQANSGMVTKFGSKQNMHLFARTKANIMHNKFLVRFTGGDASAVLTGSANFTTDGLASQANLLHTFESRELADLFVERKRLLQGNPTLSIVASKSGWSKKITIGDADIRVFFPPELGSTRKSIDRIVAAIEDAKKSVLFCLFKPTDKPLMDAIFAKADADKMMFGLVNAIRKPKPNDPTTNSNITETLIYHRYRNNSDVYKHDLFPRTGAPKGFWWEVASLPGVMKKFPVYIHHKFIIIDAETDKPTIYTGSANMSNNSLYKNDENILEIKGSKNIATFYLAEFLRLYEHYRARAMWNRWLEDRPDTYRLKIDRSWADDDYTPGTQQYKSRISMAY